jgi:hypothetical protein
MLVFNPCFFTIFNGCAFSYSWHFSEKKLALRDGSATLPWRAKVRKRSFHFKPTQTPEKAGALKLM